MRYGKELFLIMNESNLKKIITDCFVKLKEEFYELHTIEEYEEDALFPNTN